MEIPAATIDQVRTVLATGRLVAIDNDVCNVAADLKSIDAGLCLRFAPEADRFVVFHRDPNGQERFVTSAPELDPRIVERVREIADPRYDLADELDRLDARRRAEAEERVRKQTEDMHERMAFAFRKDLGAHLGLRKVVGLAERLRGRRKR